jgi:nucleotide-binding universal stress UspA family protein
VKVIRNAYQAEQTLLENEGYTLIKKVLVAVDGSENSRRAMIFALDLAEKYAASALFVNVFQFPAMYASPEDPLVYSSSRAAFIKDMRKIQEETLAKAFEEAKRLKPSLDITAELKEGEPAAQIVATAKQGGFDVIVVGHRGLSRLSEFFLGGVSERVAHLASCAVVIVK